MSQRLVERTSAFLASRSSRRSFLVRTAVVGSALAAAPVRYLLKPGSAYAAVCGPGASCSSGWTAFCCTVNRGMNKCPPGTFVGGWWKIDRSPYCCNSKGQASARYIIDCQGRCTKCRTGCGDGYCSPSCVACRCRCATGSCDTRRACCNYFRYGQCHQEIGCGGPVACRVVTCVAPYRLYDSCRSTSATDNRTAYHTAPCLNGPCT